MAEPIPHLDDYVAHLRWSGGSRNTRFGTIRQPLKNFVAWMQESGKWKETLP